MTIKVQVHDDKFNQSLGNNVMNFNKKFYKVVKGQERDIMNYQLTSGIKSLNNNEYDSQVKQMIASDPCLSDTGFSGSPACYQKLFLEAGCTEDGTDYSKMNSIADEYNKGYGITTQALDQFRLDSKRAFEAQKAPSTTNNEDRKLYDDVAKATLQCSGQAAVNLLDPCDMTKFKAESGSTQACFNKGDAPSGKTLTEGLTSRNPNTSEWPKGSGIFRKNVWSDKGYNEAQAFNAALVPNIEDLIGLGKITNYSQCISLPSVGKAKTLTGDDPAHNQTRSQLCKPYFDPVYWDPKDLKQYTTQKLTIKMKRISLGWFGHIDIPEPVYETITHNPSDDRKSQYKESRNKEQISNQDRVINLTEKVLTGQLKNYSKCITDPLATGATAIQGDDKYKNKTRYALCSPYYTKQSWIPNDISDDRKITYNPPSLVPQQISFYKPKVNKQNMCYRYASNPMRTLVYPKSVTGSCDPKWGWGYKDSNVGAGGEMSGDMCYRYASNPMRTLVYPKSVTGSCDPKWGWGYKDPNVSAGGEMSGDMCYRYALNPMRTLVYPKSVTGSCDPKWGWGYKDSNVGAGGEFTYP